MTQDTQRALAARYGAEQATQFESNPVIALQLAHKSVRRYSSKPVSRQQIETLVAAAQSAATSSNLQTWSVIAVQDPQTRDQLATFAGNQQHIRQAPLLLVWVADLSRAERLANRHDANLETLEHFETLLLATVDAALAAQNAVIALESLGLSSVYIGGLRNELKSVAEILELPAYSYPVFGLSVGYAAEDDSSEVKPRLPLNAVLHYEKYSTADEQEHIRQYDQRLAAFYQQQALPPGNWSELILKRLSSRDNLHGRERIPGVLKERRFSLD